MGWKDCGMGKEHETQGKKWVVGLKKLEWGGEPWESLGNSCSRTRSPIVIGDLEALPEAGKGRT
jgi:hypothetical protein